jgi:hypothetical protein
MSTNRKPISKESIEKLHKRFMEIVNVMTINNVELPDEFKLHYVITEHSDRRGTVVTINPFLNQSKATAYHENVRENTGNHYEGKYWSTKYHTIVDSSNEVNLENYRTNNGENLHRADYQIERL